MEVSIPLLDPRGGLEERDPPPSRVLSSLPRTLLGMTFLGVTLLGGTLLGGTFLVQASLGGMFPGVIPPEALEAVEFPGAWGDLKPN